MFNNFAVVQRAAASPGPADTKRFVSCPSGKPDRLQGRLAAIPEAGPVPLSLPHPARATILA